MPFYRYKAKNPSGKTVGGLVESQKERDAAVLLRERGLFVYSLKVEKGYLSAFGKFTGRFKKVTFNDIVTFTRQLATMTNAGIPILEALSILKGQTRNPAMTRIINEIIEKVEGGGSFSKAIERYPELFSKIYVSLIKAGEAAGMLNDVFSRLAENLEKTRDFRGKTKGALVYPGIILVGMGIVIFVMMTLVVPKMTALYQDFGMDLPLPTKILIGMSSFLVKFWWVVIGAFVLSFFTLSSWRRTAEGEAFLERLSMEIPIWGNLKKQIILVELTRTLGVLVGAGVPILEALDIVATSLESSSFREGLKEAASKVEKGFPLGLPFEENPIFPRIISQMVSVGEQSGRLPESLFKLSAYFESESDQLVRGLTTAIEPLIMVVLGLGVGFLVISVMMPIYNLTAQIK